MKEDMIIVEAEISLLSTEDGGRKTGIRSGYRPNHFFENPDNTPSPGSYIGEIQFSDLEFLLPGERRTGIVVFLRGGKIDSYISVGREWFINEGGRRIGHGKVLAIKPYDPQAIRKKLHEQ